MDHATGRNRSLDGLRGMAVLITLLHHHSYLNSGWLGVDIFFVLSGYLITGILRRSRDDVHFWKEFWIKRVTRILPPLLILLIVVGLVFRVSIQQLLGYLFSMGDLITFRTPFDALGPLWSLAIEEHFYILWPFAVRLLPTRSLFVLLLGTLAVEPVIRMIGSAFWPDWRIYYYLTPFRFDGLCLGCLLALLLELQQLKGLIAKWSLWCLAASCTVWMILRLSLGLRFTRESASVAYNGLAYSIVALASFALVGYLVTHPESWLARALSWRWLTFTGAISYGVYLYQLVIRELITHALHWTFRRAIWIDVPVTFLLAWISFRFYEQPITTWGRKKARALATSDPVSGTQTTA